MEAGADSVAVISDVVPRAGASTAKIVEEFLLLCTK
jgi:thiamine monophosphate synthase